MTDLAVRPNDMPWISPYLTVRDAAKALDFYEHAFGFARRGEPMCGPDGVVLHAEMAWKDAVIMLGPEGAYGSTTKSPASLGVASPTTLYVYCDDVDSLYRRAIKAGARVIFAPENMFWGDRVCKLVDPDGHTWNFATHVGDAPATGNGS